jgi:endonuclease/exonuclease/phosphatase (EEP) superfamily protein YafD
VPIDNCLVSPGLAVVHRERGPKLGSDHFPLVIRLAATRLTR